MVLVKKALKQYSVQKRIFMDDDFYINTDFTKVWVKGQPGVWSEWDTIGSFDQTSTCHRAETWLTNRAKQLKYQVEFQTVKNDLNTKEIVSDTKLTSMNVLEKSTEAAIDRANAMLCIKVTNKVIQGWIDDNRIPSTIAEGEIIAVFNHAIKKNIPMNVFNFRKVTKSVKLFIDNCQIVKVQIPFDKKIYYSQVERIESICNAFNSIRVEELWSQQT